MLVALADVERTFPVPMAAFGELIDGCVADVRGTSYQTFEDLLYYCRCVAGSIGRLSLGIFGARGEMTQAAELADSLGVALQLTNILRDIREDHANGRVYLPAEDLAKFDCALDPAGPVPTPEALGPGFNRLVEFEVDRAREWYDNGLRLLGLLDWRSSACTGAMAGIYRRLLEIIAADPAAVLRGRTSLSGREKATVAVKALAGRISMSPRVVVVGGGLAGITAAIALAEAGAQVTLLEARPRLGGATCSFSRDGLTVDTGQHVFLGCCTAYRGLLDQLGMTAHAPLQDRFDVTVLAPSRTAGPGGTTP